ncbi:MAG: hypothetical protein JSW39_12765, partial [Desulfobacterales bacterium]
MRRYNPTVGRIGPALTAILVLGLAMTAGGADSSPSAGEGREPQKIRIRADRLLAYVDRRVAEFYGNVRVTQGTTVVTADKLQVYYQQNLNAQARTIADEASIEKIVAEGNVEISLNEILAYADKAFYETASARMVLSGPGARVVNAGSSITGARITFYRETGR